MAPNILKKSLLNVKNITKGMFSLNEGLGRSQKYTAKINSDILKSSERKKNYLRESSFSFKRKIESSRRKKSEGIIELSKVGAVFRAPARVIADTTQGFFSRILNFAGTIMAGWMIYNLPSIIGMSQELGSRVIRLTQILQSFIPNALSILGSFGDLLGAYGRNFISFDFQDSSNRVENSMKNLNSAFSGMQGSFDEILELFTTPLTQGLDGRQDSPELGTDYSQRSPGTSGKIQPIHKQALDIISGPESGGNYNAMNQGTDSSGKILGSGDSSRIIGKPLTSMTIGEVMDRQDQSKYPRNARPDRGIHAAGRYQIIGSTMKVALRESGLSRNDMFSSENQDLLGIAVLKSQGPGAWSKYSRYSKEQIDIMYKAKNTPLGQPSAAKPQPSSPIVTPQTPLSTNFAQVTGTSGYSQGNKPLSVPYSPFKPGSGAVITSGKGLRDGRQHTGYDLAANTGTPLYAYFPGKVTNIGLDGTASSAGYGNWVVWKDDLYGSYHFFGHMVNKPPVRIGQIVNQGTLMGNVGNTGLSRGPHLHWEISNSPPQANGQFTSYEDPGSWLRNHPLKKIEGRPQNPQISPPTPSGYPASPTPKPAQISPVPREQPSERLIPEQSADSYVVPFLYPQSQSQSSGAIVGGSGQENIIYGDSSLNRFITKKLLLDLAYT